MADKKKSALQKRLKQNEGVKSGTVRMGAAGKGLRKYNAKTGRWEKIGYGSRTGAKSTSAPASLRPGTSKPPTASKPTPKATAAASNRSTGRAAMAKAAAKQGRANTTAARATPAEKTYKAASEAVSRVVRGAQGNWITAADREKSRRKAQVEANARARVIERLKERQKRGK